MAKRNMYKGISFANFSRNKNLKLFDVDLIKKDILNNIFTRRGERVKMFSYGTRIPDIVFEPLDEIALGVIEEDIQHVINNEPRVNLVDKRIVPLYDRNVVVVTLTLYYLEIDFTDTLSVNITFVT